MVKNLGELLSNIFKVQTGHYLRQFLRWDDPSRNGEIYGEILDCYEFFFNRPLYDPTCITSVQMCLFKI